MKKIVIFLILIILFGSIFLLNGEKIFLRIGSGLQKFLYLNSISKKQCYNIDKIKLSTYKKENELLRKHLNFLEDSKNNFVMANVIGKSGENNFNWFILDQGKKQGVRLGLAVLDEQGALIGTIAKVRENISFLEPLFNQGSRISADIYNSTNQEVSGIVEGRFGSMVKMKFVPIDISVTKGDSIVTSGLDKGIKRGIPIGKVQDIEKQANDIFQELTIEPIFNSNFRIVSILIP